MYCPECGFDAGNANYCPECGTELAILKQARAPRSPRTTGNGGKTGAARRPRELTSHQRASKRSGGAAQQRPAPRRASKVSPLVVWVLVAIAVAAALAVVFVVDRSGGSATGGAAAAPAPPVADTSGSYGALVARANDLYDQGAQIGQSSDNSAQDLSAQYFATAAQIYAAAWKKQPGDPAVGTDYATSLFYSGRTDAAIKQVDTVLAKNPTYQSALYNKGNYVATQARIAKQDGQSAEATRLFAQAKAAYDAAARVDPSSESGQQAAQQAALVAKQQ